MSLTLKGRGTEPRADFMERVCVFNSCAVFSGTGWESKVEGSVRRFHRGATLELSKCSRGGGRGVEVEVECEAVGALWLRERAQASGEQNLHPDSASSVTLSKPLSLVEPQFPHS